MNRFLILTIALMAILAVQSGCSNEGDPASPAGARDQEAKEYGDYSSVKAYTPGMNLGRYQFVFDIRNDSVELNRLDRTSQIDITAYATLTILGAYYDPDLRNWYIDAQISNETQYTAWGVWAVFTELGQKSIVGQDGYMYVETPPDGELKRCPVVAYAKGVHERPFHPDDSFARTIVIHLPEGTNNLMPVEFFIDAWWPTPRLTPYVEELLLNPNPDESYQLNADIRDWQSPVSEDLMVIGSIAIEGQDPVLFELFDDGNHDDGQINDHYFGGTFNFDAPTGNYVCVVEATDPEEHSFENDIQFYYENPIQPCEAYPYEVFETGEQSGVTTLTELLICEREPWDEFYLEHKPGSIPPDINFEQYCVAAIVLGDRPTDGYFIEINDVCEDGSSIYFDYTEMIPGIDCEVNQVITQPYNLLLIPRIELPGVFQKSEEIYDCPTTPDCLEFSALAKGQFSGWDVPTFEVINDFTAWTEFWQTHDPDSPPPEVDFLNASVVAVIQSETTDGYEVTIDSICPNEDPDIDGWVVTYTLDIPGDECPVASVLTQPFDIVLSEKFDGPFQWIEQPDVYDCPGQGECMDFSTLDEGDHSGWPGPQMHVFVNQGPWQAFWNNHKPGQQIPDVDFSVNSVVVVITEDKPTDGYSVHINWICPVEDGYSPGWYVNYTIEEPGDNCEVVQVITNPYEIVISDFFEFGYVIWLEETNVYECPN